MKVAGIVLAAGGAKRFGGVKQLAEIDGRPLLEFSLEAMAGAPLDDRIVVLGANADLVQEKVPLHGARIVVCDRWEEGQARSLAVGLKAAGDADAVVVALGDQPGITSRAIRMVIEGEREGAAAVRASYGESPGHPVLLRRSLFSELESLEGDSGARVVLDRPGVEVVTVNCDDLGSGVDIDTPEDLEAMGGSHSTHAGGARP